jgi:hypothetical protein
MDRKVIDDRTSSVDPTPDLRLAADSVGLEVLAKLGEAPVPLAIIWQLARERYPERSASDCLKLAEYAARSLAESRLAVVLTTGKGGEPETCAPGGQLEGVLHQIDSWSNGEHSAPALIRRS